jgi:hypothetical protein
MWARSRCPFMMARPCRSASFVWSSQCSGSGAGTRAREDAIDREAEVVTVPIADAALVAAALRRLDEAGVEIVRLALRRPSLDEVLLALTGRRAESAEDGAYPEEERSAR